MTLAWRIADHALPARVAKQVAATARDALLAELDTWPKPGLVSYVDRGSHTDMEAATFEASADAIVPFFADLTIAGSAGADMPALRTIGLAAERAMLLATGGVNTHRGAIFGLGLLCAAAGSVWPLAWHPAQLGEVVRRRWGGAISRGPIPLHSHGTDALRRFGAGGARAQAAAGFPHATEVGLPALRLARGWHRDDPNAGRVQTFFAILADMEDTNLLHRGGADGLLFAQGAAQRFLGRGGVSHPDWRPCAAQIHADFVARRLSPGGCADLLAITLFLDALARER